MPDWSDLLRRNSRDIEHVETWGGGLLKLHSLISP